MFLQLRHLASTALLALISTQLTIALPTESLFCSSDKRPPAFFLAGDSTTAVQASNGGGWGNGFLSFLEAPAWGINYGHNGATTVSFVAGGDWANVIASVKNSTDEFDTYVTIQFGHNDQKAVANISLAQYQTNLQNLSTQAKMAGATPILITPLTRRAFTSEHSATDSLHAQRLATIAAANETGTRYIDLNQASLDYVDAIGDDAAQVYDLNGNDTTHLNDYGSIVFGRMVADLILGHPPVVGGDDVDWEPEKSILYSWFRPNETLTEEIWAGRPA